MGSCVSPSSRTALSNPDLSLLDDLIDGKKKPSLPSSPAASSTTSPPPPKYAKNPRAGRPLGRNKGGGLGQSFRRMAETVHLRPKDASGKDALSTRLGEKQNAFSL